MKIKNLIIGAGISGLSAAYHLEQQKKTDYLLLEESDTVGGLCKSVFHKGFLFDYAGHVLHMKEDYTRKLLSKLLGKNVNFIKRDAFVYTQGQYVPYPFQANLYHLKDKSVIKECIDGFLEAQKEKKTDKANFKKWCRSVYGGGISKHFMLPYNEKLWRVKAEELSAAWCSSFIPAFVRQDIIKGAYFEQKKVYGYNSSFFYPKIDGAAALPNALVKKINNINIKTKALKIDAKEKKVYTENKIFEYENLISTIPLRTIARITAGISAEVKEAARALRYNSVYVLNLGVKRKIEGISWVYFPDKKYPFYRAGIQSSFSPSVAPEGASALYIEISADKKEKPDFKALEEKIIKQLTECGLLKKDDIILASLWLKIPHAYVLCDTTRDILTPKILKVMEEKNIYCLGRYGAWEYSFIEKNILDSKALAEKL